MQGVQKFGLAALRRAKWFIGKYAALLGEAASAPARARLDEAINAIAADDAENAGAAKLALAGTVTKHELRRRLRKNNMARIAAIAQDKLTDVPMLKLVKFSLPATGSSDVSLIAAGRAMAAVAAEYKQVFLDEGLPEDFLPQLLAATDALEAAIVERDGERLNRKRASLGIGVQIRNARRALRILTAFVEEKLWDRPDLIAIWRKAIRIGPKAGLDEQLPDEAADAAIAPGTTVAPAVQPASDAKVTPAAQHANGVPALVKDAA